MKLKIIARVICAAGEEEVKKYLDTLRIPQEDKDDILVDVMQQSNSGRKSPMEVLKKDYRHLRRYESPKKEAPKKQTPKETPEEQQAKDYINSLRIPQEDKDDILKDIMQQSDGGRKNAMDIVKKDYRHLSRYETKDTPKEKKSPEKKSGGGDWFSQMSDDQKKKYCELHPGSQHCGGK